MKVRLSAVPPTRVEQWVLYACTVVRQGVEAQPAGLDTLKALLQCVLGSRVRHTVAVANADAVRVRLRPEWHTACPEELRDMVYAELVATTPGKPRYPFSGRGASLAAGAVEWLREAQQDFLTHHLHQHSARGARRKLLECPGLGPKQASLFLRCLWPTARLAVLDSRVLEYLSHRLPTRVPASYPSGLSRYEAIEDHYWDYADWLGQDPAVLDLAIWYVTKAIREVTW